MSVCLGQGQEHVGPVKSRNKTSGEKRRKKKDREGRMSKLEAAEQRTLQNIHRKIRELKYRQGLEAA